MQWILQEFEDTEKLSVALDRLGIPYTWHKLVPFIGELQPVPDVGDPDAVVLFGAYTLWRTAEALSLRPGVFRIEPFLSQETWKPFLLNGDVRLVSVREAAELKADETEFFIRPVGDSKELAGTVMTQSELVSMARAVLFLSEDEIPDGSLRHDTILMMAPPVRISKEWRCWVVDQEIVTWSFYKEAGRVIYRSEIDPEALSFASDMVAFNPGYSRAYVMDVCLAESGMKLLETNSINAAGFYAADLSRLAEAVDRMQFDWADE